MFNVIRYSIWHIVFVLLVIVYSMKRGGPVVRKEDIKKLLEAIEESPVGGILGVPITDTLKMCDGDNVFKTLDRQKVWRALTPQVFRFKKLQNALNSALREEHVFTDEAQAMEFYGYTVKIVLGHHDNIKITYPDDLKLAQYILATQGVL